MSYRTIFVNECIGVGLTFTCSILETVENLFEDLNDKFEEDVAMFIKILPYMILAMLKIMNARHITNLTEEDLLIGMPHLRCVNIKVYFQTLHNFVMKILEYPFISNNKLVTVSSVGDEIIIKLTEVFGNKLKLKGRFCNLLPIMSPLEHIMPTITDNTNIPIIQYQYLRHLVDLFNNLYYNGSERTLNIFQMDIYTSRGINYDLNDVIDIAGEKFIFNVTNDQCILKDEDDESVEEYQQDDDDYYDYYEY